MSLCLLELTPPRSFSFDWWLWLAATGWSIGCVCSVKWVGFFATALVGAYTLEDLWDKFGDLRMPVVSPPRHLIYPNSLGRSERILNTGSREVYA